MVAQVLGGAGRPRRPTGEVLGEHGAEVVAQLTTGVRRPPPLLGLDEVEPGLGDAPRVGDDVVLGLERLAQLAQVAQRERSGIDGFGGCHVVPPETGGSTATSSCGPTAVSGPASSPFTQTLHVGSTRLNPLP